MIKIDENFWRTRILTDFDESVLKAEFSEIENSVMCERLFHIFEYNILNDRGVEFRLYGFNRFLDFFGLPYTSSGSFACFSNTNSEYQVGRNIFEQPIYLKYFALTENGDIIAICKDNDEFYTYYDLGKYYDFGREI